MKSIYGLVQAARCWFKSYIKTITLKEGLKKCKTGTCILYSVSELRNTIVIVYVDEILEIGEKHN